MTLLLCIFVTIVLSVLWFIVIPARKVLRFLKEFRQIDGVEDFCIDHTDTTFSALITIKGYKLNIDAKIDDRYMWKIGTLVHAIWIVHDIIIPMITKSVTAFSDNQNLRHFHYIYTLEGDLING